MSVVSSKRQDTELSVMFVNLALFQSFVSS